jgi:hypothetical protein
VRRNSQAKEINGILGENSLNAGLVQFAIPAEEIDNRDRIRRMIRLFPEHDPIGAEQDVSRIAVELSNEFAEGRRETRSLSRVRRESLRKVAEVDIHRRVRSGSIISK